MNPISIDQEEGPVLQHESPMGKHYDGVGYAGYPRGTVVTRTHDKSGFINLRLPPLLIQELYHGYVMSLPESMRKSTQLVSDEHVDSEASGRAIYVLHFGEEEGARRWESRKNVSGAVMFVSPLP